MDIENKLTEIIEERFGDRMMERIRNDYDKELLGSEIGLTPRDLLYIFFDIEKAFDMKIPKQYILEKKFNSFRNIVQMLTTESKRENAYEDQRILV